VATRRYGVGIVSGVALAQWLTRSIRRIPVVGPALSPVLCESLAAGPAPRPDPPPGAPLRPLEPSACKPATRPWAPAPVLLRC
jgi:hypothetical protein